MSADDDLGLDADLASLLDDDVPVEAKPVVKKAAKPLARKVEEPVIVEVPAEEPDTAIRVEPTLETLPAGMTVAEFTQMITDQVRAEVQAEMKSIPVATTVVNAPTPAPATPPVNLPSLVHFVEDGLTIGSMVFYRGQEYRPTPKDTWAAMTGPEQMRRYKKRMFRAGPWDGDSFDLSDPALTDEDREKLRQVMAAQG